MGIPLFRVVSPENWSETGGNLKPRSKFTFCGILAKFFQSVGGWTPSEVPSEINLGLIFVVYDINCDSINNIILLLK